MEKVFLHCLKQDRQIIKIRRRQSTAMFKGNHIATIYYTICFRLVYLKSYISQFLFKFKHDFKEVIKEVLPFKHPILYEFLVFF